MMVGKNNYSKETVKRIPSNSKGCEIGVWKGESSEKFLTKASHLTLVDAWSIEPYKQETETSQKEYIKKYKKIVKSSNVKDFELFFEEVYKSVKKKFKNKPVKILRMESREFFKINTDLFDWVYIDGDHSFEGCLFDLRNSLKILKSGGSIFGDDYGNKVGVVKAVNTFIEETGLVLNNFYKNQYQIITK